MSSKVWLITGCSSGFGSVLTKVALARGDKVIATARNVAKIEHFKAAGAATLALDITAGDAEVQQVIDEALNIYGAIDILVNNAGYLLVGAVEECSDEEAKAQFETNVFGQLAVIRAVLPHMRSRKSGIIANFGSIGGWQGTLGCGTYVATKFAMVGFTESLRLEVEPLGIDVTIVEPGIFRTKLVGNIITPAKTIDDFRPSIDTFKDQLTAIEGKQPGDPVKAAQVLVEVLTKTDRCEGRRLPARLPIGSETVPFIGQVLEKHTKSLGQWAALVSDTDHDEVLTFKSKTRKNF